MGRSGFDVARCDNQATSGGAELVLGPPVPAYALIGGSPRDLA